MDIGGDIIDVRPNPSERKDLIAVLADNVVKMVSVTGEVQATVDKYLFTAIAWSSKGKQIMCGTNTGTLCQVTPEGAIKKEHAPAPRSKGHVGTSSESRVEYQ